MWCVRVCAYLWWWCSVPVAGKYFESDATAAVLQHVLQLRGVVAHVLAVHFLYDVAHVKQALPVNHAAVKDSGDDQVVFFHSESYTLGRGRGGMMVLHL